jgi:hypothetical protein
MVHALDTGWLFPTMAVSTTSGDNRPHNTTPWVAIGAGALYVINININININSNQDLFV